jgi:hypothetical protein
MGKNTENRIQELEFAEMIFQRALKRLSQALIRIVTIKRHWEILNSVF